MIAVRWAEYAWTCEECGRGYSEADHGRREHGPRYCTGGAAVPRHAQRAMRLTVTPLVAAGPPRVIAPAAGDSTATPPRDSTRREITAADTLPMSDEIARAARARRAPRPWW